MSGFHVTTSYHRVIAFIVLLLLPVSVARGASAETQSTAASNHRSAAPATVSLTLDAPLAMFWPPAAPDYTINNVKDLAYNGTTVDCTDEAKICTLPAAIQQANSTNGTQTIALPAGTYTLTITGTSEDSSATGDLDINDDLIIEGQDTERTIIDANRYTDKNHVKMGHGCEPSINALYQHPKDMSKLATLLAQYIG